MLLQLENTGKEDIIKLLAFAKQNDLKLSLIDDNEDNYLPGRPLNEKEITKLIENSRNSGIIGLQDAHQVIRENYNAG